MPFTNLYICIRLPYSYIKQAAATLEARPASLYAFDTTGSINVIFSTVKKVVYVSVVDVWNISVLLMQPYHPCYQASGIVQRTHLLTLGWPGAAIPVLKAIEVSCYLQTLFDCVVHVALFVAIFSMAFSKDYARTVTV